MAAIRATLRRLAVTKTSTGLVGIPVDVAGRANFIAAQQRILEAIEAVPADAAYRKSVEATAQYRLNVAESTEDETAIENEIGFGQLEELIISAEEELELINFYAANKGWELANDKSWMADVKN